MKTVYRILKNIYFSIKTKKVLKKYGKPNVKNSIDTIHYIVTNEEKSVSRFGDGEFDLIKGKSIKFQEYNPVLACKLKKILSNEDNRSIVCIPAIYEFDILHTLKYKSKMFWLFYIINNHASYVTELNLKKQYYDACFSRPYIRYKKKNNQISEELFRNIKKIWDHKDILLVEGEFSRLGVGNDLFQNANTIKRILCPSKNAFSKYNEILSAVKKHYHQELVLIALGPTATVLSYELMENGMRAIDLGHIDLEYEWYLKKADEKIEIKTKSVNELETDQKIEDPKNVEYSQSIVEVIK